MSCSLHLVLLQVVEDPVPIRGGKRERNVLFNDALNTFYLWLYGVRHMVKAAKLIWFRQDF